MKSEYREEELLAITLASDGWFAFFEDAEDKECPLWAERVEAWGTFMVSYSDDVTHDDSLISTSTEVHAMKMDEETGMLDSAFIDAENFLGIRFYPALAKEVESNIVPYETLQKFPFIIKHFERVVQERKEKEEEDIPTEGRVETT
jgi:hypothetical protein